MRSLKWFKRLDALSAQEREEINQRLKETQVEENEDFKRLLLKLSYVASKGEEFEHLADAIVFLYSTTSTTIAILKDVVADLEELYQRVEELEEKVKELEEGVRK